MTFIRKNRAAHRVSHQAGAAHAAPIQDEYPTEAMRSVVALTAAGWNSLRHAC